jgi:hypothetical protein
MKSLKKPGQGWMIILRNSKKKNLADIDEKDFLCYL